MFKQRGNISKVFIKPLQFQKRFILHGKEGEDALKRDQELHKIRMQEDSNNKRKYVKYGAIAALFAASAYIAWNARLEMKDPDPDFRKDIRPMNPDGGSPATATKKIAQK